ncbi:MAG: hypothetical protein PHX25_00250 [Candidatus Pacebacteria bacterium]|nr:hypothetical protein [Candidatus Paceibacterota bacterium]
MPRGIRWNKIKPVHIRFNHCRCGRSIELWQTRCAGFCQYYDRQTWEFADAKITKVEG